MKEYATTYSIVKGVECEYANFWIQLPIYRKYREQRNLLNCMSMHLANIYALESFGSSAQSSLTDTLRIKE